MNRFLVTGGCGFIGSAFIRSVIETGTSHVLNLDKLTYAATSHSTAEVASHPRYAFCQLDICDQAALRAKLNAFRPDRIIHFAAESHVDRSIDDPSPFIITNVVGSFTLADAALRYWETLDADAKQRFLFVHVSTDEVFGSLGPDEPHFDELSPYSPNSPYAASKAASDHIVRAWQRTYGLPSVVVNMTNNYGPFQFPEKLIPMVIRSAIDGRPIPIYGDGRQIRDWLYVEDSAAGLLTAAAAGRPGRTYLFSGDAEIRNIELVSKICDVLDELCPQSPHRPHRRLITHVADRPAHDRRYGLNSKRTRAELGWRPMVSLDEGLRRTVSWYLQNQKWCGELRERYDGRRLGLGASDGR